MRLRTTSTQRSYRYLRLGIAGVVVLLGVALIVQTAGGGPLGSVSASFYTPARDVFVGSLFAVGLALLVLSGRSVEQTLLDLAAILAPVIAVVPTPIAPGDVSGVRIVCPGEDPCIPAGAVPGVDLGMTSLAAIGLLTLVIALVLAVVQRTLEARLVVAVGIAAAMMAALVLWWRLSPDTFLGGAHDAATIGFFSLIAAVATIAAVRPAGTRRRTAIRTAYAVIAAGIVLALVFLVIVAVVRRTQPEGGVPLFFIGESVALGLFAVFWVVQTAELWEDPDPAILAPR